MSSLSRKRYAIYTSLGFVSTIWFLKPELLRGGLAGRFEVYLIRRVLTIGRAYVGLPDGENVKFCLTPPNGPRKLPSSKGGLAIDVATTLCDVELKPFFHRLCIVNTALNILRHAEDESNVTGQFRGVRSQFRLEIDLKRERGVNSTVGYTKTKLTDTLDHRKTLYFNHHDLVDNTAIFTTPALVCYGSRDLASKRTFCRIKHTASGTPLSVPKLSRSLQVEGPAIILPDTAVELLIQGPQYALDQPPNCTNPPATTAYGKQELHDLIPRRYPKRSVFIPVMDRERHFILTHYAKSTPLKHVDHRSHHNFEEILGRYLYLREIQTRISIYLTSSCFNQVRLHSTFMNRSHPDRIQAEDSLVVWQNYGAPHPAHLLPSNRPIESLDHLRDAHAHHRLCPDMALSPPFRFCNLPRMSSLREYIVTRILTPRYAAQMHTAAY
ncbi:uncharacterized protein LACBIDRAFT_330012 [Laccaria bicolor S238N-H82]|uniref:Predicted protein n=1 Tax=Laccaria bicolor (strain S238N-H82 / ATCC MYA-4686) TaxID=486041 RepID=B0DJW9_LACBS|nr:uncharacterized protein LACBIDRAFT_330012 [Laccaria bicolor S238N-H82]EDR05193.1 predicted protein [Laccaria bicolor S238N-H82]|eukprot:XP_001884158.1 predicted protein [Laccaria bicolor S238N-H82]